MTKIKLETASVLAAGHFRAQGDICVPSEYAFPAMDDGGRSIVRLINLIRFAAETYCR
jgi:hypothetical protein